MALIYYVCGGCGRKLPGWAVRDHRCSATVSQEDVDQLRDLLDLMESFPSNDQRARYLLSSNWLRDRDTSQSVGSTRVPETD